MSSTVNAGTDIDVSVAWHLGVLRLSVRDYSPTFGRQRYSALGLHGPGLAVVAGLSRSFRGSAHHRRRHARLGCV